MDDNTKQIFARLTAHEFLLEVMYANLISGQPEDEAKQFLVNISDKSSQAHVPKHATQAEREAAEKYGLEIVEMCSKMIENFLQKVDKRQADIRAKMAQGL